MQQIILESGGSFGKLEPAMQAVVQAAAMSVVQCPVAKANSAPVVGLLPVVPLLTAQGYSQVFDQLLTGEHISPAEPHMQRSPHSAVLRTFCPFQEVTLMCCPPRLATKLCVWYNK